VIERIVFFGFRFFRDPPWVVTVLFVAAAAVEEVARLDDVVFPRVGRLAASVATPFLEDRRVPPVLRLGVDAEAFLLEAAVFFLGVTFLGVDAEAFLLEAAVFFLAVTFLGATPPLLDLRFGGVLGRGFLPRDSVTFLKSSNDLVSRNSFPYTSR